MKNLIVLTLPLLVLSGCIKQTSYENKSLEAKTQKDTQEVQADTQSEKKADDAVMTEEEFLNSGSAKAIEKESDLWMLYDNVEVGLSLQYPHEISTFGTENTDPQKTYIEIDVKDIGNRENPTDFTEEQAMKTIEALSAGEFGESDAFAFEPSKEVRTVGFLFAQDYMVLRRFEVCDVTLERKLNFFFNNKQITITLHGPTETLKASMPQYFQVDKDNCDDNDVWSSDKLETFYKELESGQASEEIQKWYDTFDAIAETVIFYHR